MWPPVNSNQASEDASKRIVAVRRTCKLRVKVIRSFSAKYRGSNFTNERKKEDLWIRKAKKKKASKKVLTKEVQTQ